MIYKSRDLSQCYSYMNTIKRCEVRGGFPVLIWVIGYPFFQAIIACSLRRCANWLELGGSLFGVFSDFDFVMTRNKFGFGKYQTAKNRKLFQKLRSVKTFELQSKALHQQNEKEQSWDYSRSSISSKKIRFQKKNSTKNTIVGYHIRNWTIRSFITSFSFSSPYIQGNAPAPEECVAWESFQANFLVWVPKGIFMK